jgi:hypothetical protein
VDKRQERLMERDEQAANEQAPEKLMKLSDEKLS